MIGFAHLGAAHRIPLKQEIALRALTAAQPGRQILLVAHARAAQEAFASLGVLVAEQAAVLRRLGVLITPPTAAAPREAALRARQNRHTGPRRDPYRHRGR